ncbi:DUF4158 domain-containing protein [Streptomyces halstedii]|uniref:DUF4158 domain-containing protein n=1 Tax=Streptomyces halstedii TaxID=1944 RepID=A0ABS6U151_STRHA|nr:DUF4158 domain-containing protein [Streptomyces halstedii]
MPLTSGPVKDGRRPVASWPGVRTTVGACRKFRDYVADVVKVPAGDLAKYDLLSRSAKGHRTQIREALGYRPATRADEERLTDWLADEVCPAELVEGRLREALLVQCRSDRVETPGRIERILAAARARADRAFCAPTVARLGDLCVRRLLDLVAEGNEDGTALLASLKPDPGAVGLDSLLTEITKLTAVRQLGGELLGEAGGRVAGAGDQDVPLGLPGRGRGSTDDAAGRSVRAVPPRRLPARLVGARRLTDPANPLGPDRAAVRPDGQVRHRAPAGDAGGRAGVAALHPRRPQAPHLPGPRRTWPRRAQDLRLEQREHRPPLRQGRRPDRPRQGARRDIHARAAPAPVLARPRLL